MVQYPHCVGEGCDFYLKERIAGKLKLYRMENCTKDVPANGDDDDVDDIDPF